MKKTALFIALFVTFVGYFGNQAWAEDGKNLSFENSILAKDEERVSKMMLKVDRACKSDWSNLTEDDKNLIIDIINECIIKEMGNYGIYEGNPVLVSDVYAKRMARLINACRSRWVKCTVEKKCEGENYFNHNSIFLVVLDEKYHDLERLALQEAREARFKKCENCISKNVSQQITDNVGRHFYYQRTFDKNVYEEKGGGVK